MPHDEPHVRRIVRFNAVSTISDDELALALDHIAGGSGAELHAKRESDRSSSLRAYDETGSTNKAIELGLARTGKLVTSAALVLMFAFLVLSSSPGYEVKSLAIGLAAGIIFDATVIRALLVPALMKLLGDANWWMPKWTGTVLRIPHREPATEVPAPSV